MERDILDLIDGALDDCATSVDAMRWSPESEPELESKPGHDLSEVTNLFLSPPRRAPNTLLVPFVGGAWHGRLVPIPWDQIYKPFSTLNPRWWFLEDDDTSNIIQIYRPKKVGMVFLTGLNFPMGQFTVYGCDGEYDIALLTEALDMACSTGWQPEG